MELLPILGAIAGFIVYWFAAAWWRTRRARETYYAWRSVADTHGLDVEPSNHLDAPVLRGTRNGIRLEIRPSSPERRADNRVRRLQRTTFVADIDGPVPEGLALESIDRVGPAIVDTSEGDALGLEPDAAMPAHRSIGDFYRVLEGSADAAPLGRRACAGELIDLAESVSSVEIDGSTVKAHVDEYVRDAGRLADVTDRLVAAGAAMRDAYDTTHPRSF